MTQQTIVTSALELNLGNLLGVPASVALTNALKNCDDNFIQLFDQTSLTLGIQQSIQGSLVLANTVAHAYSTTLESSNSATAAWTLTLPPNAGTSTYVLQTDGSGVTSWVAQTGGSGSLTINTTAISGATAGQLLYSDGTKLQASVTLPSGTLAATNTFAGDKTTQVATDAFVQAACLLQMSTVPMAITAGTYSFATLSTNFPVISITTSSGAVTGATVLSGGTTLAVGDLIVPAHGNQDALLRVLTELGGVAETLEVVYGGTGYTNGSGITSAAASVIPYTYLLSGALTNDVTILVTNGTYLTASQQWYIANNTTGAHVVTVAVSNGSNAPSAGRAAIIPQGTNNSRIVGIQTEGVLNCDIASILNAADLTGLGTGVATALAATAGGMNGFATTSQLTASNIAPVTVTYTSSTIMSVPDLNVIIGINANSDTTYTIAPSSSVPAPAGTKIYLRPLGFGNIQVVASAGVTIYGTNGDPYSLYTKSRYQNLTLECIATDVWVVVNGIPSYYLSLIGYDTFASSANWTFGTDWSWSANLFTHTAGSASALLAQAAPFSSLGAGLYKVVADITISGGRYRFRFDSEYTDYLTATGINVENYINVTAAGAHAFAIYPETAAQMTITNVRIYKITGTYNKLVSPVVTEGQLLLPDGIDTAPSIAFSSQPGTGFDLNGAGNIYMCWQGTPLISLGTDSGSVTAARISGLASNRLEVYSGSALTLQGNIFEIEAPYGQPIQIRGYPQASSNGSTIYIRTSPSAPVIPLVVWGESGQTGELFQVQDYSSDVLMTVDVTGRIQTNTLVVTGSMTTPSPGAVLSATAVTVGNTSGITFTTSGNHGLDQYQPVAFSGTTAPTNITFGKTYYVSSVNFSATVVSVSTTLANAIAGIIVAYSTAGSSVEIASAGSTNFPGLSTSAPASILGSGATAALQPASVIVGGAMALPLAATDGFLYIPTCAGAPSGVPTTQGVGTVAIVFDTIGGNLWVYNGGWKAAYTPTKAVAVTWQ